MQESFNKVPRGSERGPLLKHTLDLQLLIRIDTKKLQHIDVNDEKT